MFHFPNAQLTQLKLLRLLLLALNLCLLLIPEKIIFERNTILTITFIYENLKKKHDFRPVLINNYT